MTYGSDVTVIALRVLTAIMEKLKPSADDVDELRRRAPEWSHLAVDELACQVVHASLQQRASSRWGLANLARKNPRFSIRVSLIGNRFRKLRELM